MPCSDTTRMTGGRHPPGPTLFTPPHHPGATHRRGGTVGGSDRGSTSIQSTNTGEDQTTTPGYPPVPCHTQALPSHPHTTMTSSGISKYCSSSRGSSSSSSSYSISPGLTLLTSPCPPLPTTPGPPPPGGLRSPSPSPTLLFKKVSYV